MSLFKINSSRRGANARLVLAPEIKENKNKIFYGPRRFNPFKDCTPRERLEYGLLKKYGSVAGAFKFLYRYNKEIYRHKAVFYINIFNKLVKKYVKNHKLVIKNNNKINYPSNRYTVLEVEEVPERLSFGDFDDDEIDDLICKENKIKIKPIKLIKYKINEFDTSNMVDYHDYNNKEIILIQNKELKDRIKQIILAFRNRRLGLIKFKNVYNYLDYICTRVTTFNKVEPQMGEREEAPNVMMPTRQLATTSSGQRMFNEQFNNLKDLTRRYQLYWEGVIERRNIVPKQRNIAVISVPVIPSGLDLDYSSKDTGLWNVQRDGAIPIISSGYRYYRGSVRMRFVFPVLDANVWIQHRPDLPIQSYKVDIGDNIQMVDRYRNHNYAFYIQSLKVNNIVEVEIPFYQSGMYGILNKQKWVSPDFVTNLEIKDFVGLGCVLIGFENVPLDKTDVDVSIYYSLGDDMSYHTFVGFPPMVFCDKTLTRVDPEMEDAHGASEASVSTSNVVLGETENESVGIASISTPSLWTEMCSTEQNPQYKNLTDRFWFVETVTWKTEGQPSDYTLWQKDCPRSIMANINKSTVPMFVPFTIHKYWRGDIEFKFHVNSNKFQVGQLQCSWLYMSSQNSYVYDNIYSNSQRPHCLVSAGASNEATLRIPYKYYKPYMSTVAASNGVHMRSLDLGSLCIKVLSPLATSKGGPKTCGVSIFMRFINSEFTGMRDASIVEPEMMSAVGMMAAKSVIDSVIGDRNCDNPSDVKPPTMLVPTASHSWSIGTGSSEPIHNFRLNNVNSVNRDNEIGVNECDNSIPCSVFGMLKHIKWSSVDESKNKSGYLLASWDVHPQCDRNTLYMFEHTSDLDSYVVPPVGVVSSLYQYWRGSLEYRFDIIASQFHTGRILAAYIPGLSGNAEVTLQQARNSSHIVFSLQESQSFTFVVPYIADKPWWLRKYSGPQRRAEYVAPSKFVMFVLNPLVPMESVTPVVNIIPYVRAGSDFELAVPVQPSIGLGNVTANIVPTAEDTVIKPGYVSSGWYVGGWRYWGDGRKAIIRYGNTTDHITQFIPGAVKNLRKTDVVLWKPINGTTKMTVIFNNAKVKLDVEYIVLIPSDGYVYASPFPVEFRNEAIKLAQAISKGGALNNASLALDYMEDSDYAPIISTQFQPEIIVIDGDYVLVQHQMDEAEPEMMGSIINSFVGGMVGNTASKLASTKISDVKKSLHQALKSEIKNAVKPEVSRLINVINNTKSDMEADIQKWFKEMGMTTVIGNLLHVIVNPKPITIAISLANVLATLIQGSFSFIQTLTKAMTEFVQKYWGEFQGLRVVDAQSDIEDKDFMQPLLAILFTGACSMVGAVNNCKQPNGYFNLLRNVNVTANLANNVIMFLKNCAGVIGYYVKYVISYGDERLLLESMLDESLPDIKDWFKECNYLLDPRLENRLVYERQLVSRVFDACVIGSILVSNGIDKHMHGGKVVWDTYKDIVKLRNKLIERGAHADVRFECFPLWIAGPPGIGKSYISANFSRQMLEAINYRGEGTMIYYLEPGKKYWNGIQNHPVLVRDDAFQTEGTLLEEEVSSYFSICSSCILNPPLAAVEDKEKRINPLIYLLHSNFTFPTVAACKCPEALYRRRKLLIEADWTDAIRTAYPNIIDSSQLPEHHLEGFRHLKFRIANNPKDVSTTYSEWMNYESLMVIVKDTFKRFYEKEQINFRQRMKDMYRLDDNFNETYILTNMPEMENRISLKDQIRNFRQEVEARLADYDHGQVELGLIQRFRDHLVSLKNHLLPQMDDNEVKRTTRRKNLSKSNLTPEVVEEIIREEEVVGEILDQRLMSMTDYLIELGTGIRLHIDTLHYMFDEVEGLNIGDFRNFFVSIAELADVYKAKLANGNEIGVMRINLGERELYMANCDIMILLRHFGIVAETDYVTTYTTATPGIEQARAYLEHYLELMSQKGVIDVVEAAGSSLQPDEAGYSILNDLQDTEPEKQIFLKSLLSFSSLKDLAFCKHARLLLRAVKDMRAVTYCNRSKNYFIKSIFGMNELLDLDCACGMLNMSYIKILFNKLYCDINKTDIEAGIKQTPVINNNRLILQENFIQYIQDNLSCWWSCHVNPFINKCIEFLVNILPWVLDLCLQVLVMYGIGLGVGFISDWFSGGPRPITPEGPNYFKFDAPKPSKPTSMPTFKAFPQAYEANRCAMRQRIERNMVILHATWVQDEVRMVRSCRCLMIRERLMLVLRHYIEEFDRLASKYKVKFMLLFNSGGAKSKEILWSDIVSNLVYAQQEESNFTSNYGVVQLPREWPLFKSIVSCIAYRKEHANASSVADIYCLTDTASFDIPIKKCNKFIISKTEHSSEVTLDVVYSYARQGKGLCGSVLVCNNLNAGNGAIIGLHVGGSASNGIGIAEPLYKEMFETVINERKDPVVLPMPLESLDNAHVELDSNILLYGCVPDKFAHKESGKTKILPSPIAGQVYPVRLEPNPLRPNDPRQPEGSHPLRDGCNKLGSGCIIPFARSVLDLAVEDEKEELYMTTRPVRSKVEPLSYEQAICGDVNVPYFESLNWNSSEGFPLSASRPSGAHDKRWLFQLEEGKFGYKLLGMNDKLVQQFKLRDECFKKNVKPMTVYVDCLKDYKLSPEKCKIPGKTRIFSVAPVQCSIDIRRHLGDWCASIKQHRIKNGIAIGINPDSMEWTELVSYLFEVGDKIITLDYSNFGPTLMSQVVVGAIDCVNYWHEKNNVKLEHKNRVNWLLECDILNPTHLCDNVVYQTLDGISSGSPLTGEMNSIPNKLYIKCAWVEIMKEQCPEYSSLYYFNMFVRIVVYGDDLIMSVHDTVIDYFNALTIQECLGKHGVIVTGAHKDEALKPFDSIYNASFLKRGFVEHPSRKGVWLAPLDPVSVEDCVNWVKQSQDPMDALRATVESSCDMAYGRGETYYMNHREKLMDALLAVGCSIKIKTWRERDDEIFGGTGGEEEMPSLKINMPWVYDLYQKL